MARAHRSLVPSLQPLRPRSPATAGPKATSLRPSPSLQLTSLSDRYVSHFETEGPHVLLYFDSVSSG